MASRAHNQSAVDHPVKALRLDDSFETLSELMKEEKFVAVEEFNAINRLSHDEKLTQGARGAAMVESEEFRALLKNLNSCSLLKIYSLILIISPPLNFLLNFITLSDSSYRNTNT